MIDNDEPKQQHEIIELDMQVSSVSSQKVDLGTKVIYFAKLSSDDPKTVMLGTLKAGTKLKVKVYSDHAPQEANKKEERR